MTVLTSWSGNARHLPAPAVGGKAAGLLKLPDSWVPPFFVAKSGSTVVPALDRLLGLSREGDAWSGLIVRSNAVTEETADTRGAYSSVFVSPDAAQVLKAIEEVLAQPTREGDEMMAIVQVAAHTVAKGHLSNERHVADRRTSWVVEEEETSAVSAMFESLTARNKGSESLDAPVRTELLNVLRHVAFRLVDQERRVHCEWVWDGRKVWIVQRDDAHELRGGPVHRYLATRPRGRNERTVSETLALPETTLIKRLDAPETSGWSKLRRPTIFQALGMPTAVIWHLGGNEFVADESTGFSTVKTDLGGLLAAGPAVIRCDVRADKGYPDLSLPTSDPVETADEALEFMKHVAGSHYVEAGVPAEDWAFLPAALVAARASIMAQARPGAPRVRLDALWGYPDGLGLFSHDKWSHDLFTDDMEERRAYKETCLLRLPGQGWSFERVPEPHDWGHTINPTEARTASSWARRLADHLGHEVQLMILGRIDGSRGPEAMLPWHYTDHEVPTARGRVAAVPSVGVKVVAGPGDLEEADLSNRSGVLLRPKVGWHRDPEFLAQVGRSAAMAGVPVYFEGSVLGHPYYLLKSSGAVVVPVGQNEPEPTRIEYNKLVRDGVPDLVRSTGGSVRATQASPEEAQWLLRQKLIEEAFEVAETTGDQIVEELADLAETVLALSAAAGISTEDIERVRGSKRAARGGFDRLVYLQATSSSDTTEDELAEVPALFSPDVAVGSIPTPRRATSVISVEESTARRIVLCIPAVAPMRDGMPLREYGLEIGQGTVTIRHRGAEVEITIEGTGAAQGPGQLSLPVDKT